MEDNPEEIFGISEYINNHSGVFGIIKQRISDFLVNEVTSSGKIIHLTSQDVIPIPSTQFQKGNVQQPEGLKDQELELLRLLAGQTHVKAVKPSVTFKKNAVGEADYSKSEENNGVSEVKIPANDLTKEKRTAIHQYIKCHFPNLNSCTKDFGDMKCLYVKRKEHASKQDKRNSWPKSQSHVHFVLYKENIDTMEAVNVLASKLRLRPNMIFYGGVKDRRAKTSQLLSVYQVPPANISSVSKAIPKIKVGDFYYKNKPQRLGMTEGNHFHIVLREVAATDEVIEVACTSLKNNGFINYFGLQRFGSCSNASTYSIGRALLQGNWEQAVDLILLSRQNDKADLAQARQIWFEKRNPKEALHQLKPSRKFSTEGQLLNGLVRHGAKNFLNAIEMIPRNTKSLYLHAYQSYVWNKVVSKRIQKYKMQVLQGDIVRDRNGTAKPEKSDIADDAADKAKNGAMGNAANEEMGDEIAEDEDDASWNSIRTLKEEELSSTDIEKVLMPLPGYDTVYANDEIKQWYLEYLQMDGLSFDTFKNKVKSLSLKGAYRSMMVRPQSLKWSTCFYDDLTKPLVQSDLDVLENIDVTENRLKDGEFKALILEFSLPSSAYATMALREVLKMGTSTKLHTFLNSKSKAIETEPKEDKLETECATNGDDLKSKGSAGVTRNIVEEDVGERIVKKAKTDSETL